MVLDLYLNNQNGMLTQTSGNGILYLYTVIRKSTTLEF